MTPPSSPVVVAVAGHRELYLVVVGIVAGLLLGPAVLGRLSPSRYAALFPSVEAARTELAGFDQNLADLRRKLLATGVTDVALDELDTSRRTQLVADLREARRAAARLPAVTLALAAIMVIEAAAGAALASRLLIVRYSLIALWIALLLAQPGMLADVPMAFVGLVVLVALAAGLAPLPTRTAAP